MKAPEKMAVRRQSVAHPFGTIKAWMGATHFLTKTLGRVSTEMSLHVCGFQCIAATCYDLIAARLPI